MLTTQKGSAPFCSNSDCDLLQQDVNSLTTWSSTCIIIMMINMSKYKHKRIGSEITKSGYSLNGYSIATITEHIDVGVVLTSNKTCTAYLSLIMSKSLSILCNA